MTIAPGTVWKYDQKFNEVHQPVVNADESEDYKHICDFSLSDFELPQDMIHGKLIAAAPELLAAAVAAREAAELAIQSFGANPALVQLHDQLQTAILKATT